RRARRGERFRSPRRARRAAKRGTRYNSLVAARPWTRPRWRGTVGDTPNRIGRSRRRAPAGRREDPRMADSSLPPPSPDHRRIAAERFEHARRAVTSGNYDYAVQLLLTCCKLDPANLIYRQELRKTQKTRHKNNLRGGLFAFLTTAKPKARLKAAKRTR